MATSAPTETTSPKEILKGNERIDDLQRSGLRIIQDPVGNRFSTDAVLLSSFCRAKRSDKVADLGTGTGVLPLLIWAKWRPAGILGIELDAATADMAGRSIALNGLSDEIEIVQGDLKRAPELFGKARFNLVVSNPPYIKRGAGMAGPDGPRALARHEIGCTFQDVAEAAAALLVPGGRFSLVHRPDRMTDVLCALRSCGLEPKLLRTVHDKKDASPVMILVDSKKGAPAGLKVGPPLIVYGEDGKYTPETEEIYFGKEKNPSGSR